MNSSEAPAASIAPGSRLSQQQKQRRACDECRSRKLACSKEPTGCDRCRREGVACHYSPQKQMGRPRKRVRAEVSDDGRTTQTRPPPQQDLPTIGDIDSISMMPDFTAFDLDPGLVDSGPSLFDMLDPSLSATFVQPGVGIGSQVEPGTVGPGDRYSGPWGGLVGLGSEKESLDALAVNEPEAWTQQPHQAKSTPPPPRPLLNPHLTKGIPFSGLDDLGLEPDLMPSPPPLDSDRSPTPATTAATRDSPDSLSSQPQRAPDEIPRISFFPTIRVPPNGPCSCLARIYLALDSLQSLPGKVGPAMTCARGAAKTAWEVTECPSCSPPDFTSPLLKPSTNSTQNLMMLGALLPSIANAYNTILPMIDDEAEACRVDAAAARLRDPARPAPELVFDLDMYGGLWGRVTSRCGDLGGIMAAKSLDPDTWRSLVRALLRFDVYGLSGEFCGGSKVQSAGLVNIERQIGLKDIVDFLLERSRARHAKIDELVAAGQIVCANNCAPLPPGQKHPCENVLEVARLSIERLVIA